jgi:hypothetical protein
VTHLGTWSAPVTPAVAGSRHYRPTLPFDITCECLKHQTPNISNTLRMQKKGPPIFCDCSIASAGSVLHAWMGGHAQTGASAIFAAVRWTRRGQNGLSSVARYLLTVLT